MFDNRINFDERYDDEDSERTTLYFIAPKEMLAEYGYSYPDAVSAELSLEFPLNNLVAECACVGISPTNEYGEDYDWNDTELSFNEIAELILLAKNELGLSV